jgi:hypothetical protein
VLHDDRNVAGDDAGVGRVGLDFLGIVKVVEAEITAAARENRETISDGVAILVEDQDFDVGFGVAGVQDTDRLMTGHLGSGAVAVGGNIAFGDGPLFASDRIHGIGQMRAVARTLLSNQSWRNNQVFFRFIF